ncbi:hypothetical protein C8R45DRAFT_838942 [Mycena sanguinolenta]|nr:hypothetical protein C8R45DRAFT_838942 [Mycena sanguinolenta]
MTQAAAEVYTESVWQNTEPACATPRRGGHRAKNVGASMGGGQAYPQNLAHPQWLLPILVALFASKPFQRIAGWTNMLFMAFAPDLHAFYAATFDKLCTWDHCQRRAKHIERNFAPNLSVFLTATFNFGPRTITLPHIDFRNLAWGWCAITALGDFDADCGGHLVLWDLKLIIWFPPGATILIPSAILRHSNTRIQEHETRFSFTQYMPAGLFRWVYNDFPTDKDIDESPLTTLEEYAKQRRDCACRWADRVRMYRRWDGPIQRL